MGLGWCCFRNYAAHAEEIGGDISEEYPRFFLKPASAHVEADENGNNVIELMNEEDHIDHEAELVVRLGDDLRPEAMCIGCDTTTQYQDGVLQVSMKVNGETKQDAPTSLMIHSVEDLVEHLSAWYDLSPGDLVWTGTPAGVGPMYKGDFVEAYLTNQKGEIVSRLNANCVVNG